jgi:hypothetical protein
LQFKLKFDISLVPTIDPRRVSIGLRPLQQETGVEVPIPLIDDTPASSLAEPTARPSTEKVLPLEPETPRARTHKPTKSSISRPTPRPIVLPTQSDIAVDVASLSDSEIQQRDDQDLERGNRLPLQTLEPLPNGEMPLRSAFSPRTSAEDTRLLKQISIEPPTPVTTDAAGELVTLPHKRRSPSPTQEEEERELDLLQDDPPQAALHLPSLSVKTATKKDGSGGVSPGSGTGSGVSSPYFTPLDSAGPTGAPTSMGEAPANTEAAT